MRIVRGRIYHKLTDEISDMFSAFISNLDDDISIDKFDKKLAQRIGVKYVKSMPFARYALFSILKYKNFPKDSEIIMPPITIKPMIDIVLMLGLKPIFVDLDLNTLCFDTEELEKNINSNTRAIFITYLFGIIPNVEDIVQISKENNLYIIEDFSQAINAKFNNKNIGTFGNVSIYSSSSLKTVDTYIGGHVFCNDENLYKFLNEENNSLPKMNRIFLFKKILLNFIRNLFSKSLVFTFFTYPLLNLIKNLNFEMYQKALGARLNLKLVENMPDEWKYKYTSIQAKRGLKQLEMLDLIDRVKIKNVNLFKKYLGEKYFKYLPTELENSYNVYWQYPIYIKNPDIFIKFVEKYNIDMGTTNLSLCSHLDIYKEYNKPTPNACKIKYNYMFVPTYLGLKEKEIKYIADVIGKYFKEYGND